MFINQYLENCRVFNNGHCGGFFAELKTSLLILLQHLFIKTKI